eukprot:126409_1
MDLIFTDTEISILRGEDIDKMKPIIAEKLKQFKGQEIEHFFWKFIQIIKGKTENKTPFIPYTINKRPKDDCNDEKQEQLNKGKQQQQKESLSMVIDFEEAEKGGKGMCPKGDVGLHKLESYDNPSKCDQCQAPKNKSDLFRCWNCANNGCSSQYFCISCCLENEKQFKLEKEMDLIKSNIIRNELVIQPHLALDLLCGLPTVTSLNKIIDDIQQLDHRNVNPKYSMFLIDVDNLKALNTSLTHEGADQVIKHIGLILKKYAKDVNDGKWKHQHLSHCWAFRQGGDEFALVVKSGNNWAYNINFNNFYSSWKKEINGLVKEDFMSEYKVDEKQLFEGKKTMKNRKEKQILSALNDTGIDKKNQDEIMKIFNASVKEKNIQFNIQKIGISVGVFIPGHPSKEKNWIKRAEEAQDEAKQVLGKNQIRIYYDDDDDKPGIIPADKTDKCLTDGCREGIK